MKKKINWDSIPSDFGAAFTRVFDKCPNEVGYIQKILNAEFEKHEVKVKSPNEVYTYFTKIFPSFYDSVIFSPGCQDALFKMLQCYKNLPHTKYTRIREKEGENSIEVAIVVGVTLGIALSWGLASWITSDGEDEKKEDDKKEADETENAEGSEGETEESKDECFPKDIPGHGGEWGY